MTSRALLLFVLTLAPGLFAAVPPACGEWPKKPAWAWTNEERVAYRANEQCLQARRLEADVQDNNEGTCRATGDVKDFVYGTETPELLFPGELLDYVLDTAFHSDEELAQRRRIFFSRRAKELRLPDDFWTVVETGAGEYLRLMRKQRKIRDQLNTASVSDSQALRAELIQSHKFNCPLRLKTLENLDAALSEHLFLKFLYVAAAPGLCVSGGGNPKTKVHYVTTARNCP